MWVLAQYSHAKLQDFKHLNVDPGLDFLLRLESINSLAISCLEIGLETQQQYIYYQGLSGSPNAWFHPAFFTASWIYVITNPAPNGIKWLSHSGQCSLPCQYVQQGGKYDLLVVK